MENASKALLIAGSVLIVILLIAVGMKIFNSTSGTTDSVETTMSATEVSMFNNKFLQYVGKNKNKSAVIGLVNATIVNNETSNHKVGIRYRGTGVNALYEDNLVKNLLNIASNATCSEFEIKVETDKMQDGYITVIRVLEQ